MLKQPRILYFIGGPVPTAEERKDARRYGANTAFRNAALIGSSETGIEKCDGVAGKIPAAYAKIARADKVIADFNKGVEPAPVGNEAPPPPPPPPPAPIDANAGWGQPPAPAATVPPAPAQPQPGLVPTGA